MRKYFVYKFSNVKTQHKYQTIKTKSCNISATRCCDGREVAVKLLKTGTYRERYYNGDFLPKELALHYKATEGPHCPGLIFFLCEIT